MSKGDSSTYLGIVQLQTFLPSVIKQTKRMHFEEAATELREKIEFFRPVQKTIFEKERLLLALAFARKI